MRITPTPLTAALAGVFTGLAMSWLWPRLGDDTLYWIAAFLLVVALPAHAFVVGFGQRPGTTGAVDAALLKRVVAWLFAAIAVIVLVRILPL
ncbi:hypothetical protein [Pseudoxanthomonas suwonensis]|uniref:Transmembrane protein n=1 Tax=Pseudoxanthomonas suwonensis TaxID=314722 RepID=A0A0E3Z1M5_9GAMM|nr:hypothetical protein [Pseudoxanthomonas suwonensis]AKC86693.1 hypothetical protein WQ53_07920 [Pseudoxanthomonas suwonensis]